MEIFMINTRVMAWERFMYIFELYTTDMFRLWGEGEERQGASCMLKLIQKFLLSLSERLT